MIDANGQTYEFVYDYHDRLKSISRDDGARIRQYTYDLAGNMIQVQDYDGFVTHYDYDGIQLPITNRCQF